ncbi:hypothetical protein OH491_06555 [Termitidicoccus mucosus]|uniref:Uncharacterized protein n=1 Tax=Termitidicoccus mucosus TaxID=1184151 RepID=A0A178IG89_9BACT|nr:hypothetical protein AW736_18425 [Opitutaceae bacterium TSB47]
MKKLYFIIPIVACGIFYIFYAQKKDGIEAAEHARQEQIAKDIAERRRLENQKREEAYKDAVAASEQRRIEREKRTAEEQANAELKEKVTDARDLAYRERDRQMGQVRKLKEAISEEKAALDKLTEQINLQQIQIDYLKSETQKVTQTKAVFEQTLIKINAAEKAAADAARLAAQQKKS